MFVLAMFPGCSHLKSLIVNAVCKYGVYTASDQRWTILQAIKDWRWEKPWNEAGFVHSCSTRSKKGLIGMQLAAQATQGGLEISLCTTL